MKVMLHINANLEADELKRQLSHSEIMEFILELDLSVACAGFTQDLILRLAESLKGDATTQEMVGLGNQIAQMEGDGE